MWVPGRVVISQLWRNSRRLVQGLLIDVSCLAFGGQNSGFGGRSLGIEGRNWRFWGLNVGFGERNLGSGGVGFWGTSPWKGSEGCALLRTLPEEGLEIWRLETGIWISGFEFLLDGFPQHL